MTAAAPSSNEIQARVAASGRIEAPPAVVYGILADYNHEHPAIVPKPYFQKVEVEEGGVGAGTVIWVEMRVLGTTRGFRHRVSEPEPGRVLMESDVDGSSATTFTVEAEPDGGSRLTIATEFRFRRWLLAPVERWMTTTVARRIYPKEIALIAARARTLAVNPPAAAPPAPSAPRP